MKDLAHTQHAPEVTQLASRLGSAVRLNHGAEILAKIKDMTSDMVEKLEQEAAEAAELKQWCDKERSVNPLPRRRKLMLSVGEPFNQAGESRVQVCQVQGGC